MMHRSILLKMTPMPFKGMGIYMLKLEEIERAGGAQAYQQQMISEQEMEQQKKGWFK